MPYADKKSRAERYFFKYHFKPSFKEAEAARKASWYERNKEKVIAKVLARREALKSSKT